MKRLLAIFSIVIFSALSILSCSRKTQPVSSSQNGGDVKALPPCIIYKTRADYRNFVAVSLSDDKSMITSYPDVTDIRKQGSGIYPLNLTDNYLLDNRGIGPDAAFLSITYEDYRKLQNTPSSQELFRFILDSDPILEMYQCGNRYQYRDIIAELNAVIESGKLSECKKIK